MDRRLTRRRLVVGSLSLPAAALLGGEGFARTQGAPAQPTPDPSLSDWGVVRAQFRLDPSLLHLASFYLASHSEPVRRAIARHRDGLDADPFTYVSENEFGREQEVASAAASYLDTDPDLIALTDSTTMGLGLVYGSLRLRPGDELLTTEHDHYSTHEALRLRSVADRVALRKVRLYPPRAPERATATGIVRALLRAVGPRTRLVAITWVHSSSGVKLPLRAIADALDAINARRPAGRRIMLVVDAVHALGAERPRVEELGCDVLVAGAHKWLWGPRGTGLVWASPAAWGRIAPIIPSFDPRSYGAWIQGRSPQAPPGPATTPGGFHSFEHRWALSEAFAFQQAIGPDRIARRTRALSRRLRAGIAATPGVSLRSPGGRLASGIVCCEVDGRSAQEVVGALRARHRIVASVTPYAVQLVRFGTSCLNTEAEIDTVVDALAGLA